ncbi:hypothetical protein IQ06DRAFT_90915 [Phaeosphaeriaceae sp. SRC1lsM3a]|nr:hypothetical protein IQ06DRAFT_90915 [Stagonospora sp. SRC1lsM3a]
MLQQGQFRCKSWGDGLDAALALLVLTLGIKMSVSNTACAASYSLFDQACAEAVPSSKERSIVIFTLCFVGREQP